MDEETKRLIESLGRLTNASDDYYEKIKEQTDVYNTMLGAGDKVGASFAKNQIIISKTNQSYEDQMRALGLTKNALGEFERITANLSFTQKQRLAEEEYASKQIKAREELSARMHTMLADKTGTLIDGLGKFGKGLNNTLLDSTKGQSKYAGMLESAGDAAQNLGNAFGPLGKVVGAVVNVMAQLVGAAFKQNEALNEAYETLSEIGAVDSKGIQGMFESLQNAGFTIAEIGKFNKVVKEAGPNLAFIGQTAAEGSQKLAASFKSITNTGLEKELRMLGHTSESMYKGFAQYEGMMARLGHTQNKTAQQLGKESGAYLKTLDQLTKLTGIQRDELQKNIEAELNEGSYRAKIAAMNEEEAKNVMETMGTLKSQMGPEMYEGIRDIIANGGQVATDAAAKVYAIMGEDAIKISKQVLDNTLKPAEATRQYGIALNEGIKEFNKGAEDGTSALILNAKELGIAGKDIDFAANMARKAGDLQEKVTEDQKKQAMMQNDAQRAAEVMSRLTTRAFDQAKDRIVNLVSVELSGAFTKLLKVVHHMGLGLAKFVKGLTDLDLTDLFETPADIKEEIEKTKAEARKAEEVEMAGMPSTRGLTGEEAMFAQADWQSRNAGKSEELQKKVKELEAKYKQKTGYGVELDTSKEEENLQKTMLELQRSKVEASKLQEKLDAKAYTNEEERVKLQNEKNAIDKKIVENAKKFEKIETDLTKKAERQSAGPSAPATTAKPAAGGKQTAAPLPPTGAGGGRGSAGGAPMPTAGPSGGGRGSAGGAPMPTAGPSGGGGTGPSATGAPSGTDVSKLIKFQGDNLGNKEHYDELDSATRGNFEKMIADFGKPVQINAAFRDPEEQKRLYDAWIARGKSGNPVAPPGRSKHNHGQALDLNSAQVNELEKLGLLEKYGFKRIQGDPPHIEMAKYGGVFSGPDSGYPVMLHGKEMIIPMPDTNKLEEAISGVNKTSLSDAGVNNTFNQGANIDQIIGMQTELMNLLASKLDAMEAHLAKSNNIQEDILTYSTA